MLRTNESFLTYVKGLYEQQVRKERIIVKEFTKGQKLLSQGEATSKVIVISEGITKCFFTEDNDKEYILEFLGKGEIVGEIESIKQVNCLCSIEAVTDVTAFAISAEFFLTLIQDDIRLNNLLLEVFSERLINTSSRASYQQLYTTEYSLNKLIELQSRQGIHISKEDMASYLGITLRSLNRAYKTLKE